MTTGGILITTFTPIGLRMRIINQDHVTRVSQGGVACMLGGRGCMMKIKIPFYLRAMGGSWILLVALLSLGVVCTSSANNQPIQYCVIGAGPAGMHCSSPPASSRIGNFQIESFQLYAADSEI